MESETFGVQSIFGANTQRGLVEVTLGPTTMTVYPSKAREMAIQLLECASAAEGDEVLLAILTHIGLGENEKILLLRGMRDEREKIAERARNEMRKAIVFDQE